MLALLWYIYDNQTKNNINPVLAVFALDHATALLCPSPAFWLFYVSYFPDVWNMRDSAFSFLTTQYRPKL